ncbi:MAG: hypothetical protein U1E87_09260 [Alphaproteobacteria bacterium]
MIYDQETHRVIGNLGWVDKGALWIYDERTTRESALPVGACAYLTIKPGQKGFFRVTHHQSLGVVASVRQFSRPDYAVATLKVADAGASLSGDCSAWSNVDAYVLFQPEAALPMLFHVNVATGRARQLDTSWFNPDTYDLGYQSLLESITLSNGLIVISVQRSSDLVVMDPLRNERVGTIRLAGRLGNPELRATSQSEFIATDYDTLCRVDVPSLRMVKSALLQEECPYAKGGTMRQFIGDFAIRPDGKCIVARPFSSDVILVDPVSLEILARAHVGGQPLAVCALADDKVLTRDWQTGDPRLVSLAA